MKANVRTLLIETPFFLFSAIAAYLKSPKAFSLSSIVPQAKRNSLFPESEKNAHSPL
jgi:hypothetical protein